MRTPNYMSPREVALIVLFLCAVFAVYGLEILLLAKYLLDLARRKPGRKIVLTKCVVSLHVLAVMGVVCLLYARFIEPNWVDLNVTTLRTTKLTSAGFRIVQISDLHCDRTPRNEEKAVRLINGLRPDVVVATGDYLNRTRAPVLARLKDMLGRLDAPLGKFAVGCDVEVHRDIRLGVFADSGFRLLYEDEATVTKGEDAINIWGLSHEGSDACRGLLSKTQADAFNVFLFHTPDLIEDVSGPHVDLYLCGHTHGGQIRLPLYGALVTHSAFGKKYESGLYRVGETTLYVNRGLGMGRPQVRFLARPEIAVFDILPESR